MYQNKNFFLPTYPNFFSEVIGNTLSIFFGLTIIVGFLQFEKLFKRGLCSANSRRKLDVTRRHIIM